MKSICRVIVAAALSRTAVGALSGDFNVLSMNVAGLPEILQSNDVPGDKTTNAETIGTDFANYDYDLIHVQEDFNYHAYIYANDDHPFRTATSGGAGIGSGLNSLANYAWVDFTRIGWDDCSDASGSDCLTPKGFTFMRLILDDGVYVDAYNLHTDAGTEDGDETARNSNLQQVADYIDAWSTGNAVVVFGDTNSRYTRTADNIEIFATQNGMTDVFVELELGGVDPTVESLCDNPQILNQTCEVVDKIFYRGSAMLTVEATYFHYESPKFLQSDGNILSDHNPITANFTWTSSDFLRQSSFFGGPHGTWFSDVPALAAISSPKASVLTFRGADRLDSVGLTLSDGTNFTHGGTGGDESTLTLASDEYWTSAELCSGQKDGETRNFYIKATTSAGNTLEAGTATDDCGTATAPDGWQVVGFLGQDGDEMDQLALVYAPQ